jgi:hypothetical protein
VKKCVFIHTNERQWLGALVSQYSLKRNSRDPDAFEVRLLHTRDFPYLRAREGDKFLRGGVQRVWQMDDLQSFTPLRFQPPSQMQWQGRAVLIDPDIFALGDVNELLDRDMEGAAVMGRHRSDKPDKQQNLATSCMLMDCARLRHWQPEQEFEELFRFERDYKDWIVLKHEDPQLIGFFEPWWNDFDHLDENTRFLHNTRRRTQPWKTGLQVDYTPADKLRKKPWLAGLNGLRARIFGQYGLLGRYSQHPDINQQNLFFGLLRECLEGGHVSEQLVREEIASRHVRADALEVMVAAPRLPPAPQ